MYNVADVLYSSIDNRFFFALVIEVRKYCVCSIGEMAIRVIESNLIYFLTNMNNQFNMI